MNDRPDFPPLLKGNPVPSHVDPFDKALAEALTTEAEPGLIHYCEAEDTARAAVTLAPEEPLNTAIGALFAVQLGLADALGALAPPEVAVHFVWPTGLKVNGAFCGGFRVAASTDDASEEPEWLIVGFDVPVMQFTDGGEAPDRTTLHAEGCVDITSKTLIEAWSRHMMAWLHTYMADGIAPLHEHWRGKCDAVGEEIETPQKGLFLGLDEHGGMLLRQDDETQLIPLTHALETT